MIKIILFFLVWSTVFTAWNFIGLYLNGGELLITEYNQGILVAETILSIFIASGAIGLALGYLLKRR